MKFILHIGTHKTGTTHIQRVAWKNRDRLYEQGVLYPSYEIIGLGGSNTHHHIAHSLADDESFITRGQVKKLIDKIGVDKSVQQTLISAEAFCRHVLQEENGGDFWDAHEAYIVRVASYFGRESKICIVLRRQDDYGASLYQERIKKTSYTGSFVEFIAEQKHSFEYDKEIELWQRYFHKVEVLVYEDLIQGGGLAEKFFSSMSIDASQFENVESIRNASLPYDFTEFKRVLNMTLIDPSTKEQIMNHMLFDSDSEILEVSKKERHWLSSCDREDFINRFASSNANVLREYTSLTRDSLFPEFESQDTPQYTGLSSEKFAKLLGKYLLMNEGFNSGK